MNLNFYDFLDILSFLISLSVYFQKSVPYYLKCFPFYFICSFIIGMVEENLQRHGKYNTAIYNSWGIIEFCFYFFVLREIIETPKFKKLILLVIGIYPLICILFLYFQKQVGFNPVNYSLGCIMVIVSCIYYFFELFQKTEFPSLVSLQSFWITTAILFNYALAFPTFAFISFMNKIPKIIANNLDTIFYIINSLVLILFSIAFLCRIRMSKSIS